jgi:hypothetical protein
MLIRGRIQQQTCYYVIPQGLQDKYICTYQFALIILYDNSLKPNKEAL